MNFNYIDVETIGKYKNVFFCYNLFKYMCPANEYLHLNVEAIEQYKMYLKKNFTSS